MQGKEFLFMILYVRLSCFSEWIGNLVVVLVVTSSCYGPYGPLVGPWFGGTLVGGVGFVYRKVMLILHEH